MIDDDLLDGRVLDGRVVDGAAIDSGVIVAFDPGRNLGVAFVTADGRLLRQKVITPAELAQLELPPQSTLVVGDGTGHRELVAALASLGRNAVVVPEEGTTLEGRALYFAANPPRGLARLLPAGMRSPPTNIDGYAAYAIALRWLRRRP